MYDLKKGFTLAEVLITLGIIGVVAALTIPTLMSKYRSIVFKAQFNKAYSVLSQVVEKWRDDCGGDIWSIYYDDSDRKGTQLRNDFYSYFKGEANNPTSEIKPYYTSAKNSTLSIHNCPAGCCVQPAKNSYRVVDGIMYLACARDNVINFAFDINGNDKGPNKWGVDLFDFDLGQDNKLTTYRNAYYCSIYINRTTTHVNDGMSCTNFAVGDENYFKKIDF